MKLKTVQRDDIQLGKTLAWNLYDRNGLLMLGAGHAIDSQSQLDALMLRGIFHVSEGANTIDVQKDIPPFDHMDNIYARLEKLLFHPDEIDFSENIINLCTILRLACDASTDAVLASILLRSEGRYSVKHSIDVAIICEVIGRLLDLSDGDRLSLVAAAFTQNIGMILLQDTLHSQKEPLSDFQQLSIREHPARGVDILNDVGVKDRLWLDVILRHHESADGKGYPTGIKGDDLILPARLVALADFYCAKITGRDYRPPLSSHKAMQYIFPAGDKRVDSALAELFIKTLGIYLPGTIVRLKSGHLAVVTFRGSKIQFPVVHKITGADGLPLKEPMRKDTSEEGGAVVEVIPARNIRVNRHWLWKSGAFRK